MKQDKTTKRGSKNLDMHDSDFGFEKSSFELGRSGKIIGKIVFWTIIALLVFFFGKTAIWEYHYYQEKEGSPRPVAEKNTDDEPVQELDETEITVEQRAEYTVAPDRPRYLSIEKLGVSKARVLSVGTRANTELDTPNNIFDVGWYNQSGKPGGGGTMVIDGHNGGPNVEGVFKHINNLYEGDLIVIERGDGAKFTYRVVDNKEIPLADADAYMTTAFSSPTAGVESLTLISCTGEWSDKQKTYLSRQFVRAVLEK